MGWRLLIFDFSLPYEFVLKVEIAPCYLSGYMINEWIWVTLY